MVLASQSGRQGSSRRYRASKSRRNSNSLWLLLLTTAAIAAGAYWLWSPNQSETPTPQPPQPPEAPESLALVDTPLTHSPPQPLNAQNAASPTKPTASSTPQPTKPASAPQTDPQTPKPSNQQPTPAIAHPTPASANTTSASRLPTAWSLDQSLKPSPQPTQSSPNTIASAPPAPSPVASQTTTPPGSSPGIPAPGPSTPAPGSPGTSGAAHNQPAPASVNQANRLPASDSVARGMQMIQAGQLVEGRTLLSQLLVENADRWSNSEAQAVRQTLTQVNQTLVFSPQLAPGDPLAEYYTIQPSDLLARIAPRYHVTYQLLEQINKVDARRIRAGQKIKVIKGPFHVVVDKSDFRLDLFLVDPAGREIYVRSFSVGLGESDSTPLGNWIVRRGGKVANPGWTNPRTSEYFTPDDPKNPIGDYWIALEGTEPRTQDLMGYGIHGTIEPDSVGRAVSMGCIRLRDEDIAMIYSLLVEGASTVTIQP